MWAADRLSTPLQKEPSPPLCQPPAAREDEEPDIEALQRSPTRSRRERPFRLPLPFPAECGDCSFLVFFTHVEISQKHLGEHQPGSPPTGGPDSGSPRMPPSRSETDGKIRAGSIGSLTSNCHRWRGCQLLVLHLFRLPAAEEAFLDTSRPSCCQCHPVFWLPLWHLLVSDLLSEASARSHCGRWLRARRWHR